MRVVTVSGTASEVGKTGLVCELVARLPGWAAIKVTRGHYRSCGRDPETCCVSHLLADEPRVFREPEDLEVAGKDTARYVAAGAAAVRWVVCRRGQEAEGIARALAEVEGAPGVVVEGNTVAPACRPDLAIMVAPPDAPEVKSSATRILDLVDALYVPDDAAARAAAADPAPLVGAASGERWWPVWGPSDLDAVAEAARAGGRAGALGG